MAYICDFPGCGREVKSHRSLIRHKENLHKPATPPAQGAAVAAPAQPAAPPSSAPEPLPLKVPEPRPRYQCATCGKPVKRTDASCGNCHHMLDWAGIA